MDRMQIKDVLAGRKLGQEVTVELEAGPDRAFKKIDADASGLISPEELKAAREQMRQRMGERRQRRLEGGCCGRCGGRGGAEKEE